MAKTVLVVDDNALIRQALCELFKREADFSADNQQARASNRRSSLLAVQQSLSSQILPVTGQQIECEKAWRVSTVK